MTNQIVINSARIYGEEPCDIAINDGVITDMGQGLLGERTVDAAGLIALPGLVDLHTHLREPGQENAETVFTGTRAAAVGGYTCVHAMANTTPVADSAEVVEQVKKLGEDAAWVDVRPVGAVTVGLAGQTLADLEGMAASAAKVRVFSDDGKCVANSALMMEALKFVKSIDGVIAQHAQDPLLTEKSQMNESALSCELGLPGWPAVAEESIVARDVLMAQHLGARVHVCHLSTAGSVEIVRWAKSRGIDVTAEATPHHIMLTEDKARTHDARFKVNPPLRRQEDVEAVRQGLADGTIDIVGTDHAPHPAETKNCEWSQASFGMTGLETALPIVVDAMVNTGRMTYRDVARVLSEAPARIGRVADQGQPLQPGSPANIVLFDDTVTRVVDPRDQYTRSVNSPFKGMTLPGQVMYTFYKGSATVVGGRPVPKEEREDALA